jgi:hypothetical protein
LKFKIHSRLHSQYRGCVFQVSAHLVEQS